MAISTQDLIDNVRSRADIQRTKHITDDEIVVWLNDDGSQIYNKLVSSREEYITRNAQFSLGITDFIETDSVSIVNGFGLLVDGTPDVGFPIFGLNVAPSYYKIISFTITPVDACNTGNTFFNLKKNGTDIGKLIEVASGSLEPAFDDSLNTVFYSTDTLTLSVTAVTPGPGWNSTITIVAVPFTPVTTKNGARVPNDFFKPIKIELPLGNGRKREIFPLGSVHQSAVTDLWEYEITDQTILIWPDLDVQVGPYNLRYNPRYSSMTLTPMTYLPKELEQFKEVMELGAAAMCKLKRRMPEDASALKAQQDEMFKAAIEAIPGRRGGPKKIPMPNSERATFRGGFVPYRRY
jgi:hypothetical protein